MSRIAKLFHAKERKQLSGTVGAYEVTRQSFAFSRSQALAVLALISLSLAIINLFPFLPLDGGHIFWALAEKVRGRADPVLGDGGRERGRLRARDRCCSSSA